MKRIFFNFLFCIFATLYCSVISAKTTEYIFKDSGQSYPYSVLPTGENFTFKFTKNPEDKVTQLKAGRYVLLSIYQDSSINESYTDSYIKERARCFVFDSRFYTYSLCFLPNDFDIKNKDRFWGYTSQVPNWKWLLTRFLLPALCAFALFFYAGGRQKT